MTEPWEIVAAEFAYGAQNVGALPPPEGDEIAFAGRSNVGKSSLMNALMGRRNLVRTSSTPGCTRQINIFRTRARDGRQFHLVDLPGYGYARRSKEERSAWADLIERYLLEREALKAVVVLVDARRGMEDEERELQAFLATRKASVPLIVVATKIDKIAKSKRRAAVDSIGAARAIAVSAVDGEGLGQLWTAMRRAVDSASG